MPQALKRNLTNDTENIASNRKKLKVTHDSYNRMQGDVLTCGDGTCGKLGLGEDIIERKRLGVVNLPDPAIQVYAGGMHTVCLTSTGQVYTFGCNDDGGLGRDTSVDGSEAVPGRVNLPAPIVMVSAGDSHTAALTDDGRVFAWGSFRDSSGAFGLTMNGIERMPVELIQEEVFVKIASGCDHLVCLTSDGELFTLGNAEQGQLGRVAECFAVRGGRRGLSYILSPSRVYARGLRNRKISFCDVWTGQYATYAKDKKTKEILAWGLNNYYQLGCGDAVNKYVPEPATLFNQVGEWAMISGGQHHAIALNSEGKVYTIGRDEYGRLGLGQDCGLKMAPTLVSDLRDSKCTSVAAGGHVSFAITSNGFIYSWGMGSSLQLGTGTEDDQFVPERIISREVETRSGLMVSSGGQHTVVIAKNIQNGH